MTIKKSQTAVVFALLLLCALLAGCGAPVDAAAPADGGYTVAVALAGGSGRSSVKSPAELTVAGGQMTARIVWSSANYTYMKLGGQTYYPVEGEKTSTFLLPVASLDAPLDTVAQTTAMSQPHDIDYTLRFDPATLKKAGGPPAAVLLAGGLVLLAALGAAALRLKKRKGGAGQ